jgi:hypothetical protein
VQSFSTEREGAAEIFGRLADQAGKTGIWPLAFKLARDMLNNRSASGATENGQVGRLRRSEKITEQR